MSAGDRACAPERGLPKPTRAWRRRAFVVLVLLACATTVTATPAWARSQAGLIRAIAHILAGAHINGTASVRVWDLDSGAQVYGRNIHKLLAPASNEKLVTSAAALELWGADHRFKTELYGGAAAPDADGVLHGGLFLKGYGDPTLSDQSYQKHVLHFTTSDMSHFVAAIKALGVTRVAGRIVGDDGSFDSARTVAGWKPGLAAYCAPLSALTLNGNMLGGARVSDPALHAARVLKQLLEDAGIAVSGGAVDGTVPAGATLLYTENSAQLWRVLRFMDKHSDNFMAEMLAKGLGLDFGTGGTTAAGTVVARKFLLSSGVRMTEVRLRDGSGLSYKDRLSALSVTELLAAMSKQTDYKIYWGALPVAGVDGTLSRRMRGTAAARNLHAKTGSLSIASCLSGYVTTADHQSLVFSVLMNGAHLSTAAAHKAQDAIGAAMAAAHL